MLSGTQGLTIGSISSVIFLKKIYFFLFYVSRCLPVCVCLCPMRGFGVLKGQKGASDSRELELQVVVTCYVASGN